MLWALVLVLSKMCIIYIQGCVCVCADTHELAVSLNEHCLKKSYLGAAWEAPSVK